MRNPLKKRLIAGCGHPFKQEGKVTAFGENTKTKVPINNGTTPWCQECLGKMAIRCCVCDCVIFVGDLVRTPIMKSDYVATEGVRCLDSERHVYIGCLGWDCADTGADRAGVWMPGPEGKGELERMKSPYIIAMGG